MERVEHAHRVRQTGAQRGGVAAERVEGSHGDLLAPGRVALGEPAGQDAAAATRHNVEQPGLAGGLPRAAGRAGQVDQTGGEHGGMAGVGGQERGLVHSERAHAGQPNGVVDQRGAVLADRAHHRAPTDPELDRHGGHRLAELADPPAGHPRRPRRERGPRRELDAGLRPRRCGHSGCSQRHSRLIQISVTGRPALGRSRTRTSRRRCAVATAAQSGQPTRSAAVSIASSSSPSCSSTASNTNPSSPSNTAPASRARVASDSTWGLLRSDPSTTKSEAQAPHQAEAEDRVSVSPPRSMTKSPVTGTQGSVQTSPGFESPIDSQEMPVHATPGIGDTWPAQEGRSRAVPDQVTAPRDVARLPRCYVSLDDMGSSRVSDVGRAAVRDSTTVWRAG